VQRALHWEENNTPTPADFAAAERRYADDCRRLAAALDGIDNDAAAEFRLEADVCALWADEIEGQNRFSAEIYADAIDEWHDAIAGRMEARGGMSLMLADCLTVEREAA